MHGDKSQSERSRVLESFLAGECPVLVCTALLGRGIDLPNVSQVRMQTLRNDQDHSGHLLQTHYVRRGIYISVVSYGIEKAMC